MANAAIFNALMGRPVRSVDDYLTQYENRDAQKAAIQQNALAAMQNQQLREAQIGEILLAAYQNEWQMFGADGLPFLATSYADSQKLYQAQKPILEKKLAEQGMTLLYTVAWPPQGIYSKKPLASAPSTKYFIAASVALRLSRRMAVSA